jgi:hypothetical protein
MVFLTIIASVGFNELAFFVGISYIFGRFLYSFGYMNSPGMRVPGALVLDLSLIGQLYMAVMTCVKQWPK